MGAHKSSDMITKNQMNDSEILAELQNDKRKKKEKRNQLNYSQKEAAKEASWCTQTSSHGRKKNHQSPLGPEQFSACTFGTPQHGSLWWLNLFTIYFQLQYYSLTVFSDEMELSLNSMNQTLATKC